MGEKGDGKTSPFSVLKERLALPEVKIVVNVLPVLALWIDICWRYSSGQVKLGPP